MEEFNIVNGILEATVSKTETIALPPYDFFVSQTEAAKQERDRAQANYDWHLSTLEKYKEHGLDKPQDK